MNKKNIENVELPHELFLRARRSTKIRNVFANNMATDIKLSKAQISKIIQSSGSFGSWLRNIGNRISTNVAISLLGLVSKLKSSAINRFGRKINGKRAVRAGKDLLYLFQMKI